MEQMVLQIFQTGEADGNVDEVRIVIGQAVYGPGGNFSVPVEPYDCPENSSSSSID